MCIDIPERFLINTSMLITCNQTWNIIVTYLSKILLVTCQSVAYATHLLPLEGQGHLLTPI